jgi:hypothetical protein
MPTVYSLPAATFNGDNLDLLQRLGLLGTYCKGSDACRRMMILAAGGSLVAQGVLLCLLNGNGPMNLGFPIQVFRKQNGFSVRPWCAFKGNHPIYKKLMLANLVFANVVNSQMFKIMTPSDTELLTAFNEFVGSQSDTDKGYATLAHECDDVFQKLFLDTLSRLVEEFPPTSGAGGGAAAAAAE